MRHYEENLRHVVRPERPGERTTAPKVVLSDYEALYLAYLLRHYAAYDAPGNHRDIAWAYVEYIDMVVRDEERTTVAIFAHTHDAFEVLEQALISLNGGEREMQKNIRKTIDTLQEEV